MFYSGFDTPRDPNLKNLWQEIGAKLSNNNSLNPNQLQLLDYEGNIPKVIPPWHFEYFYDFFVISLLTRIQFDKDAKRYFFAHAPSLVNPPVILNKLVENPSIHALLIKFALQLYDPATLFNKPNCIDNEYTFSLLKALNQKTRDRVSLFAKNPVEFSELFYKMEKWDLAKTLFEKTYVERCLEASFIHKYASCLHNLQQDQLAIEHLDVFIKKASTLNLRTNRNSHDRINIYIIMGLCHFSIYTQQFEPKYQPNPEFINDEDETVINEALNTLDRAQFYLRQSLDIVESRFKNENSFNKLKVTYKKIIYKLELLIEKKTFQLEWEMSNLHSYQKALNSIREIRGLKCGEANFINVNWTKLATLENQCNLALQMNQGAFNNQETTLQNVELYSYSNLEPKSSNYITRQRYDHSGSQGLYSPHFFHSQKAVQFLENCPPLQSPEHVLSQSSHLNQSQWHQGSMNIWSANKKGQQQEQSNIDSCQFNNNSVC